MFIRKLKIAWIITLLVSSFGITGCDNDPGDPFEDTAEEIEDTTEDAADKVDDEV